MESSAIEALMSLGDEKNMKQGTRKRNAGGALLGLPPKVPPKVPFKDLVDDGKTRSRRRLAKDNVVVASVVEDEPSMEEEEPKPEEQVPPKDGKVFSQEEQNNYALTDKLVLSNFETPASRFLDTKPFVLVEYHIDHLNHSMNVFADKPVGYILLIEAVHYPKIGDQHSFMEYALLVKQKEGKWELLFKRCTTDKVYWDADCLRERSFRMPVIQNTLGGTANFEACLGRWHLDHVKKYLTLKPDRFNVLIRTNLIHFDDIKKVHRIMYKEGDKFYTQQLEVAFENNDIFWDTIFTLNMYISKINRK
jgi:hypothetical protein